MQAYGTSEVYVNLVPGQTLLFVLSGSEVPSEGDTLLYSGGTYRVQDILHEVREIPAIPPAGPNEGEEARHVSRVQVEVVVVP